MLGKQEVKSSDPKQVCQNFRLKLIQHLNINHKPSCIYSICESASSLCIPISSHYATQYCPMQHHEYPELLKQVLTEAGQ